MKGCLVMKKGKNAVLALAIAASLLVSGCGNTTDSSDEKKSDETTSVTQTSASESEASSASDTSSSAQDTSHSETTTTTTTSASDSSESESETTTTAASSESTSQTTTTTSKEQTTTSSASQSKQQTTTTAAQTTTLPPLTTSAETKATQQHSSSDNNFQRPTSGRWIGGVVVCDRDKGAKIRGLISFGSTDSLARNFCSMVNDVKKAVGSNVNVYTMGAPVSSAFYTPKGMSGVTTDQHKAITDLNKYLKNVKNVDAYAALAPHVNEYIYFRTDHHWTELAAYYAVEAFAKAAGVPYKPLSSYKAGVKKGFTGSMYFYSKCPEFKRYPDTYYYWKPKNSYTTTYYNGYFRNGRRSSLFLDYFIGSGCYCTVLGSDMNLAEIKTDVKNGRTLVLIKDSYGNALVPYFVGSFEKIYVLDMRYTHVNLRSFFKQVGATDILFGSSLSSFYTPSRVSGIRAIL